MQYQIIYHETDNIIEIQCSGEADPQGFKDYTLALSQYEHLGPKSRLLFDHRELNGDRLSLSDIKEITHFFKSFSGQMKKFKQAIVVYPHTDSSKAKFFQLLIDDMKEKGKIETRIFTDYDQAYKWLNSQMYIEL